MNYWIIHIGESKEKYFRQAFAEYQKRISGQDLLEDITLRPGKTPGRALSDQEISTVLEKEAEEFEKALENPKIARSYKIALCIEGKSLSSEGLAALFEKQAQAGKSGVAFLIGSSWGMADRIKEKCDLRLSFSPMTFAHSLFSVMLAEQIYRAASILHGGKYHK